MSAAGGPTADTRWQRLLRALRVDRSPSARAKPWVRIEIGPSVGGWVLRLAIGLIACGCAALTVSGAFWWVLTGLAVALVIIRPQGMAPAMLALALGLTLVLSGGDPWRWQSFALLLGVHLLVVLGATNGDLSWRGRLELAVLLPALRRLLVMQAVAQLLAVVMAWLSSQAVRSGGLAVLGGVGLAVLAWALLSRLAQTLRG
ncbi:hypothetical protein GCM10009841_14710 [Microlunatus panaciterrae]|uniref:Uncharacterized protein n=1 Tax=Microlunatus panaciterrae TaxID=400768 RepID=A0ABS2RM15_9ACTN|nr:hypothetical protein [Microlunatus panaciterrae]MBM7800031.1 hypothetical protein [Microlunatus panaciterrae]